PPGDVRPAFEGDLKLIRETIDSQFGEGCAEILLPEDKIVILNKAPAIDRMDEIIIDGNVQEALAFELGKGYKVILRMHAARAIEKSLSRNWVIVDDGAVNPIEKGANALGVGILSAYPDIALGDEIVVLSPDKKAIATGRAMMQGKEMVGKKGVGVKTRWYGEREGHKFLSSGQTWQDVIEANKWFFERKIPKAIGFIKNVAEQEEEEMAVSFSGGKDSLATLLLALDAGLKPKVLFVDTGLEFEETISYVKEMAEYYGLKLQMESAKDVFWRDAPNFGPPGKDFRWCCKTCKLGPTVRLIKRHYPEGVVSLIGQRAYESEQRAKKGRRWRNPWVHGQLGVSPIQDWTALHVWLYIFQRGTPYNVWYDRGLERIGCWLCPACDMADLDIVKKYYPGYERWEDFLKDYSEKRGYSEKWFELNLWRWRKLPKGLVDLLERENIKLKVDEKALEPRGETTFDFFSQEGYQPCVGGVSIEGMYTRRLDMKRVSNLLNILGEIKCDEKTDSCSFEDVDVFGEGGVVVKAENEKEAKKLLGNLKDTILRAHLCVGCGICTGRCDCGALVVDEQVHVDEEKCIHCGECLGPCPVIGYGDREFEF
ncbi:MAG: phosphoadenosine phosphosulfate reductase family protein, partial [Thermoplasmata archaeon]